MRKAVEFLIIDPQNDFCNPKGALFVTGADKDSERLAECITRLSDQINDIHVTLDSHHFVDIAHPIFWINDKGDHPAPFTLISKKDVMDGKWYPKNPTWSKRALDYVTSLEVNKRYLLCIWPPHCLIGSWGHNVVDPVYKAITEWEKKFNLVDYVTKGSNLFTEHYSAVQADVPDAKDPGTSLNIQLIKILQDAPLIALSGEALSHCVANTVRDIANNFGEDNIKKMVLLIDTTSSVPGFEQMGEDFLKEMTRRGMQVCKSTEFNP